MCLCFFAKYFDAIRLDMQILILVLSFKTSLHSYHISSATAVHYRFQKIFRPQLVVCS